MLSQAKGSFIPSLHERRSTPEGDRLKAIIRDAIASAARKSRRKILELPDGLSDEQNAALYRKKGRELFRYFCKYYGDPAATAYDCLGKHYREIAVDQFRNQTLQ
jgi:hypothetical protein